MRKIKNMRKKDKYIKILQNVLFFKKNNIKSDIVG